MINFPKLTGLRVFFGKEIGKKIVKDGPNIKLPGTIVDAVKKTVDEFGGICNRSAISYPHTLNIISSLNSRFYTTGPGSESKDEPNHSIKNGVDDHKNRTVEYIENSRDVYKVPLAEYNKQVEEVGKLKDQLIAEMPDWKQAYDELFIKYDKETERRIKAEQRRIKAEQHLEKAKDDLNALKGMIGAVGSRGVIDKFFTSFVKTYLPKKEPGKSYSPSQIQKAYTDFLNDTNNPVAADLMRNFSDKKAEEVAATYLSLFGKLLWFDHTLYESLIKTNTYDGFLSFLNYIPAIIVDSDKVYLEKLLSVFLKHSEEWKDYAYKM